MKLAVAAAVAAALLLAGAPSAHAAARTDLVVRTDAGADRDDVARALGGAVGLSVADDTFVVEDALADAAQPPSVRWSAPDSEVRATRQPTDVCFRACPFALDGQPELALVGAEDAWDVTTGSRDVIVAVLDGIADTSHADLAGKVTAGPTFVTDPCTDATAVEASHATAVAGLVGAATDTGAGIASLGWDTRVLSVAVLDPCGIGRASEVSAGIRWSVDRGARIVNLSLAGTSHPVLADAIAYAQGRGALVVAAAGNAASSAQVYPAAYPGVVAVGSTTVEGSALSQFTNRGSWVDLFAPGESIVSTSTLTGGYASYNGTSFSAPIVSAAAALVMASHPRFTAEDVLQRMVRTAVPIAGGRRVHAGEAVTDPPGGYVLAAADGGAFTFGDAVYRGSAGGIRLNQPIVASATAGTRGYWEAAGDGGIFAFGVPYYGSMGGTRLNRPIVGMAATPSGRGYWLVASDGGIFAFGDAGFFGSTGAIRLNQPIVGMASTPSGRGYWLVARDGGIFSFGDAAFAGSTGAIRLVSPIVGMAAATRSSYWLAAADGGVFAFGGAPFLGSGVGSAGPGVVGIAAAPKAAGYWLARADGAALTFGDAPDAGRTGPLNSPIVAIGAT